MAQFNSSTLGLLNLSVKVLGWLAPGKLVDDLRLDLDFGEVRKIQAEACIIAFLGLRLVR